MHHKQVQTFHCPACHKAFPNNTGMTYDHHLKVVKQHVSVEHPAIPKSWHNLYSTRRVANKLRRLVIT